MRLIDADEFLENARKELYYCEECCKCESEQFCSIYKNVLSQPAIDAEPVRYGKWISDCLRNYGQALKLDKDGCITNNICHCSECGKQLIGSDEYTVFGKYCPNCGAVMRGDYYSKK